MSVQKASWQRSPHEQCDVLADCQMKENYFNISLVVSPSPCLSPCLSVCLPAAPSLQVNADTVRQIDHALHLRLLLRPERLLQQTEEEEKGGSGGRE